MPSMGIAGQLNGSSKDSERRSRSVHTLDKEETDHASQRQFVPPSVLEEQLAHDEHLLQDVKSWLISFGELKQGTSVSLRFKIDQSNLPAQKPFSMLPILTGWVRSWFEKSLSKSMSETQDRNSLTWLLQYVADYVDLGHSHLENEEVNDLCLALLNVCLNARQQSHLEGCLLGLLAVARIEEFPRSCLRDVLMTLSSANVILDKPLSRADELVQILAVGSLQKETIADLFSALSTVAATRSSTSSLPNGDTDFSKHLNPARGAVRYISGLLELCGLHEKPIIDLEDLFVILKDAAETHLLRLATEILDLLTILLTSSRIDELLGDEQLFASLLNIYDLCKEASIIPADNTLTKTKSSKEDQHKRERRYNHDHEQAVLRFKESLARLLPVMDSRNASNVWRETRDLIQHQAASKRSNALEYLVKQALCVPGKNTAWEEELQFLLDNVIICDTTEADHYTERKEWEWTNPVGVADATKLIDEMVTLRINQRISVLELCSFAIHEAAMYIDGTYDQSTIEKSALNVGIAALEKLLIVFLQETDIRVIVPLLKELTKLSRDFSNQGMTEEIQPYATLIITSLQDRILKFSKDGDGEEYVCLLATHTLRDIFLRSMADGTSTANKAYQALLKIADCKNGVSLRCRLAAMAVLVRIRCDTSYLIYIQHDAEAKQIAAALGKTNESLGAMLAQSMERMSEEEKASQSIKHRELVRRQLWIYPNEQEACLEGFPVPEDYRTYTTDYKDDTSLNQGLDVSQWVYIVTSNLQQDKDWETYSYLLVHLGAQLTNTKLFEHSQELLHQLRGFLCGRVRDVDKMFTPPQDIGLDKSDVALCFFHILSRMIPYYKMQAPVSKHEGVDVGRRGVDIVRAFMYGMSNKYEGTSISCIHALSVCCFEIPEAIASEYPGIVRAISTSIYRPHLLVHILEFLAQVARLPYLHSNFMEEEIKTVFYICIRCLQQLREAEAGKANTTSATNITSDPKRSNTVRRRVAVQTPYRAAKLKEIGLPQYSCALAYHSMIFWFLSIPLGRRHTYVKRVTDQLVRKDGDAEEDIDQQTIVLIDMMQRSAFSDLAETSRDEGFAGDDIETAAYVVGNAVLTIETNKMDGASQITKRQASGTTHAIYRPNVPALPVHHDTGFFEQLKMRGLHDKVAPSHTLLNLIASAVPLETDEQPLKLNLQEDYVNRGIKMIDNKPAVDSHRIGVVLLKGNQIYESQYLANTDGTKDFDTFLQSIGTRVSLRQPSPFVSWGLTEEEDGSETIAWRDRINEIVYEVSTLMPNTDEYQQTRKKSHIGNCDVIIVFSQSVHPWEWSNFASHVTMVQILITPANLVSNQEDSDDYEHDYYQVQVLTKGEYQNISAAAETKVVSKASLGPLVRLLALNANIFSQCFRNTKNGDAEFPSSWRYRLQAIVQLAQRTKQRVVDNEDASGRRYDFSRWT